MLRYTIRRLIQAVPTLVGVVVLIFFFVRALPGDPARLYAGTDADPATVEAVRQQFGLDRSLPEQFAYFVAGLSRGDLGRSFRANMSVTSLLARHFRATLVLASIATVIATLLGVLLGITAARRRNSFIDLSITSASVLGISTPSFFLGILLIYLFAVKLRVLPVAGNVSLKGLVLPAVTLAVASLGTIARFARSSLLETIANDYVRTASAKGLPRSRVINKHALRNALIPVVTIVGLQFGFLLSGTVIVETVFNFHGLGWLLIQSVEARDYPAVQGLMLVFALQFIVINLVVDVLYGVIDPRISYD
ncbi:MAG TPA: ABC transporter permease [Trueperaceae bacterium]|nr:ABC transporter permease [Trueperaceae bacterium]